jgi:predicted Ser/Thr protein kinase
MAASADGAEPPLKPFPGVSGSFGLSPRSQAVQRCPDPLLGTDCGGVRIVSLLAEGGMGRVYLGEQARPQRPVAVKVMRNQRTTEKSLRRFLREVEVLGALLHAGIARIYTAGSVMVAGDEVPFVVMEYVEDGLPITTYADRNNASLAVRLRLFREACDAVSCAHARGFVHRDIKPANILVDREGRVKVIDFGIAFSAAADPSAQVAKTTFGDRAGTLQYMSPEQVGGRPGSIDARSDVYALGLVLHELVLGSLPYDVAEMSLHDATRTICRERSTWSLRRAPHVPHTVTAIIGRCLHKKAARRFADAGTLAAAVANVPDPGKYPQPTAVPRWSGGPARVVGGIVAAACLGAVLSVVIGRPPPTPRERAVETDPVPSGWIRRGDSLYLFTKEQGTLLEAIQQARKRGARLLVIDDKEENDFVIARLEGWTWLGLVNGFIASHEPDQAWKEFASPRQAWQIVDDSASPTYFRWCEGQPQGFLHEVGASIHTNGLWYDHFWTDRLYLCFEKRLDPASR